MKLRQRAGPDYFQIHAAFTRKYTPVYTVKQRIDCLDCLHFNRKEHRCMLGEENCILIDGLRASDKPKECRYCYWWNSVTKSCRRDPIGGCIYELQASKQGQAAVLADDPTEVPCRSCPYSRDHSGQPCVGFCMKNVLKAWEEARLEVRDELRAGTYSGPPVRIRKLVKGGSG